MHDLGYSTEQLITPMSNMWLANSEITEYSLGQNSDGMHLRELAATGMCPTSQNSSKTTARTTLFFHEGNARDIPMAIFSARTHILEGFNDGFLQMTGYPFNDLLNNFMWERLFRVDDITDPRLAADLTTTCMQIGVFSTKSLNGNRNIYTQLCVIRTGGGLTAGRHLMITFVALGNEIMWLPEPMPTVPQACGVGCHAHHHHHHQQQQQQQQQQRQQQQPMPMSVPVSQSPSPARSPSPPASPLNERQSLAERRKRMHMRSTSERQLVQVPIERSPKPWETSITKFTFRSPRKVGRSHSEPMAFIEDAAPGF